MKIRLQKPAVNISKLMGSKNEKARGSVDMKKFGYEWKSKQLNM